MRTNVKELREKYQGLFTGDLFKDVDVNIMINDRKASSGSASLTIQVTKGDDKVSTTLYVIERQFKDNTTSEFIVYVNDESHQVIFNGNSVNKAQGYVERYIVNSTKRLLGIEIENPEKKVQETTETVESETQTEETSEESLES